MNNIKLRDTKEYSKAANDNTINRYKAYKQSIRKAIKMFCDLGGWQIEQTCNIKPHSKHRLIYSGIDLLHLQNCLMKLPDEYLEAASQYGYDEPYSPYDLECAVEIIASILIYQNH